MIKTRLFIFITALLLTLLMVVGCDVSPSLNASIPEGCVDASLQLALGRDLDIYFTDGNLIKNISSLSKVVHFDYCLEPQWTWTNEKDKPYGEVSFKELPVDGKLGWVTPGLWKIKVYGYSEYGPSFFGEQDVYFSSNNNVAFVFVEPMEGFTNSSLSIELNQPMYSENQYEYSYIYSLVDCSGAVINEDFLIYNPVVNNENSLENGIYKANVDVIPAGSYSLNISIYSNPKNDGSLSLSEVKRGAYVGGMSKGLFFCLGVSLTVKGSIEPSEYAIGGIEISGLAIIGSISHGELIKDSTVKFTLNNETVVDTSNYSVSYQWFVNGNKIDGEIGDSLDYVFTTYGPKEVSCLIVYRNLNDSNKVYNALIKDTFTLTPKASL